MTQACHPKCPTISTACKATVQSFEWTFSLGEVGTFSQEIGMVLLDWFDFGIVLGLGPFWTDWCTSWICWSLGLNGSFLRWCHVDMMECSCSCLYGRDRQSLTSSQSHHFNLDLPFRSPYLSSALFTCLVNSPDWMWSNESLCCEMSAGCPYCVMYRGTL